MDIIIIGTGNTASVMGRRILAAGHRIIQVYDRDPQHAAQLASRFGAEPISDPGNLKMTEGLILLAIADDAYASFVPRLPRTDALLVHTAGAIPLSILKDISPRHGVLYPLQSLRKELDSIPEFPLLIDAEGEQSLEQLRVFASGLSDTVIRADDATRLKYHLGAVLAGNFTNHLFALAEDWCKKEGLAFSLLQPLILETAGRLRSVSPGQTQTGPAVRNDVQTLQKHRRLLDAYPLLRNLYETLTKSIRQWQRDR